MMNPYLGFSALLMAGLDGVENKIHPGEAATKDLYHLPPEEDAKIPTVCSSLDQALETSTRTAPSCPRAACSPMRTSMPTSS
jgi:glutamine synthetase